MSKGKISSLRSLNVPALIRFCHNSESLAKALAEALKRFSAKRVIVVSGAYFKPDWLDSMHNNHGISSEEYSSDKHDALSESWNVEEFHHHEITDSTVSEARNLMTRLKKSSYEIIVAVGGGRVIDVCKWVSANSGIPVVVMPTLASHDGMASPVAVLTEDGITHSMAAEMPGAIIVDLPLIARSPEESLRAGAGDLISNLTAVLDWQLSVQQKGENFDEFAAFLSTAAAHTLFATERKNPYSEENLPHLIEGLVMSGIAMEIAGNSRPASGAEHCIAHAIDAMGISDAPHGLKVALTARFMAYVHGLDTELWDAFYYRAGLPGRLKDLDISVDDFVQAVKKAPATRPGRYTILDELSDETEDIRRLIAESGIDAEINSKQTL